MQQKFTQFETHWANSLEKAIELLENDRFGVAITDVSLGGENISPVIYALKQSFPDLTLVYLIFKTVYCSPYFPFVPFCLLRLSVACLINSADVPEFPCFMLPPELHGMVCLILLLLRRHCAGQLYRDFS